MKICLSALLKHIRKYSIVLILFGSFGQIFSINMATQFRTPYSLYETIYEGLLTVQYDIQGLVNNDDDQSKIILESSLEKLESLQCLYQTTISKSGLNGILDNERDFLQNLIDRIDAMIDNLEGDSSDTNSDLIRKNINFLQLLKINLDS